MSFTELLADKTIKAKDKTIALSQWIAGHAKKIPELIAYSYTATGSNKGTCIEALEFASRSHPKLVTQSWLELATASLADKAPRVKWESAKLIGNIARLYPQQLNEAINGLLINSEDPGTVVRWSAAFALGEIIQLKTKHNKTLVPAAEAICRREEKNSIKKIYTSALKKSAAAGK